MNAAHWHLALNTAPPIIVVIAMVLVAIGLHHRRSDLARTGTALLVSSAVLAVPVYLTGKAAVMVIRNRPGISLLSVGDHHSAAARALIALEAAGAFGVAGLLRYRRRSLPRAWSVTCLALAAIATTLLLHTAYIGGHISHPETLRGYDQRTGSAAHAE